jgi:hypothetical protein
VAVRVQPDGPRGFGLDFRDLKPTDRVTLTGLRERWESAFPEQHA